MQLSISLSDGFLIHVGVTAVGVVMMVSSPSYMMVAYSCCMCKPVVLNHQFNCVIIITRTMFMVLSS